MKKYRLLSQILLTTEGEILWRLENRDLLDIEGEGPDVLSAINDLIKNSNQQIDILGDKTDFRKLSKEEVSKILIENLTEVIKMCNHSYYNESKSLISDFEFDHFLKGLQKLEELYPEYVDKNTPTQSVGHSVSEGFEKIRHSKPMLSLDNTYSKEDIIKFLKDTNAKEYVVELKIDGIAMGIEYKDGKINIGATRGDGNVGENVTQNLKQLESVPNTINLNDDLILRGEVFMPKSVFENLNEEYEKDGKQKMANPRNAASGAMRLLDSLESKRRKLDAFWYVLVDPLKYGVHNHYEALQYIKGLGFKINPHTRVCKTIDEVWNTVEEFESMRNKLDYEIDGVVIKVNDFGTQEKLGFTAKAPRWAKAYKYETAKVESVVRDIYLTVGRTGRITPNASFDKVRVAGTDIAFASLHNEDYIKDKDIRVGDTVIVHKAAEIIPEIVEVVLDKRDKNSKPYEFPKTCPECDSKLLRVEGEKDTYCINPNCKAKIVESIAYFGSRKAMNIDGLGQTRVKAMYNKGLLNKITDIYKLKDHKDELMGIERMGEKSVRSLLDEIEKSKGNSLELFLVSLGIRHTGTRLSNVIVGTYKNIDDLMNASIEELRELDTVGDITAKVIYEFFKNEENIELINEFKNLGLNMNYIEPESSGLELEKDLEGKTIVITGSFEKFKRSEIKELLESRGAKVTGSVSKNTDILVAGEKAGSKLAKATELGITIWSEADLLG